MKTTNYYVEAVDSEGELCLLCHDPDRKFVFLKDRWMLSRDRVAIFDNVREAYKAFAHILDNTTEVYTDMKLQTKKVTKYPAFEVSEEADRLLTNLAEKMDMTPSQLIVKGLRLVEAAIEFNEAKPE